jgi:hypothetical protein
MNNVSKPLRKLCPMTRIDEITFVICINNKFLTVFEFESDFAIAIHIKENILKQLLEYCVVHL